MADPDFQAFLSAQIGDLQCQINVLKEQLSARHENEVRPLRNQISSLSADNRTLRHSLEIQKPPEDVLQRDIGAPKDEPVALAFVDSDSRSGVGMSVSDDQGCHKATGPFLLAIKPEENTRNLSKTSVQVSECALSNSKTERNSMGDNSRDFYSNGDCDFLAPGELNDNKSSSSSDDGAVQAFSQKSSSSIQSATKQVDSHEKCFSGAESESLAFSGRGSNMSAKAQIAVQRALNFKNEVGDDKPIYGSSDAPSALSEDGDGRVEAASSEVLDEQYPLLAVWRKNEQADLVTRVASIGERKRKGGLSAFSNRSVTSNASEGALHADRQVLLRPNAAAHMAWDMIALLAVIYDFVAIPLQIFDANQDSHIVQDALSVPNIIVRFFWLADIPLQFLTGYIDDKGRQHMSLNRVARRYAITWLLPDVALCGLDWTEFILQASGRHPVARGILCACRMLRGQRLIRLAEAPELHEFMVEHVHNERILLTLSILSVLVLMGFYTHLIACGWYGLGVTGKDEATSVTKHAKIERTSLFDRYVWAFHCALGLFTGEHVEPPRNSRERVYTIFVLFFTFMMTIWFVSTITTNMTRLQIMSGQRATQFTALGRYLADHHISRDLCIKVRRNAQYIVATQTKHAPESSIELLSLISTPLRRELHFEVHSPLLTVHPFFRSYIDLYPTAIKKVCHEAIKLLTFSPSDVVFTEFEAPTVPRMFWVAEGELRYIQEGMHIAKTVCYGNWLSEALLWTKWTHRGTLESKTESDLMALDAHRFSTIVANFPGVQVRNYAVQFCKSLETTAEEEITDVGLENSEAEWLVEVAFGSSTRRTRKTSNGGKGVRFALSVRRQTKRQTHVDNRRATGVARVTGRRQTGARKASITGSSDDWKSDEDENLTTNATNIFTSVMHR